MDERVDEEAVRHVAELASVDLTDAEVERFREEFADILGYFDRLDEVPDEEPLEARENVLRADEVRPSLSPEDALANAAETADGRFTGPHVS